MCFYGFASVPRQPLCRCVLQRLSVADFKLPCLKLWAHMLKASLPIYERFVGFASLQSLWAFISGVLALLAPPATQTWLFPQTTAIHCYLFTNHYHPWLPCQRELACGKALFSHTALLAISSILTFNLSYTPQD